MTEPPGPPVPAASPPSGAGNELLDNDSTASSDDGPYLDPSLKRALANHPYGLELYRAYRITTGAIRDYTPSPDMDSQDLAEDAVSIDAATIQRDQITCLRQRDYDLLNHLNGRFIQHYPPSARGALYTSLVNFLIMVATPIMKDPAHFGPDLVHSDPSLVYPSCSTWFLQATNIIGSSTYLTHVADLSIQEGACGFVIFQVLHAYTTGFCAYAYASDFISFMGPCLATFTSHPRPTTLDQSPRPGPSVTTPPLPAPAATDSPTWRTVATAPPPTRAPTPSATVSTTTATNPLPPEPQHGLYWVGVVGFNNIGFTRERLLRAASSHESVHAVLDTVGLSQDRHRTFCYRKFHSTRSGPNPRTPRNEGFLLGFRTLPLATDFLSGKRALLGNLDIFTNLYTGTVTLTSRGLTREAAALKVAALLRNDSDRDSAQKDSSSDSGTTRTPACTAGAGVSSSSDAPAGTIGAGAPSSPAIHAGTTDAEISSSTLAGASSSSDIPADITDAGTSSSSAIHAGTTDAGISSSTLAGASSSSDIPADTTGNTDDGRPPPSILPVLMTEMEMPPYPFTLLLPDDRTLDITSKDSALDTGFFMLTGEFMATTAKPRGQLYFHGTNRYSVVLSPAASSEWGSTELSLPPAPESPPDMAGITPGSRERPHGETPPRAPRQRQGARSH
jgi:hypothetical protein